MKTLFRNLWFIAFASIALTSSNAYSRQFVKYKCLASGENAEIVIETRERLNVQPLKSSTFDVLIDFDKNRVHFLNNESYRFSFVSNFILENVTEEEFVLKGYEAADKISYDLKINRKNGELYFLKSWDLELKSYKIIELKGICSPNQQELKFSLKKPSEKKSIRFGEVFIEPQFNIAWDFNDGSAAVQVRDNGVLKFGHIDKNGDVVIPFNYDFVRNFSEEYAGACVKDVENKCGYIDKKGNWVIEPYYNEVWDFSDGVASVKIGSVNTFINVKTGKERIEGGQKTAYINKKGEILMNRFFDRAYGFSEGLGSVGNGSDRELLWGYIDKAGEQVIPMKFGPGLISAVGKFVDGIAPALHGHWSNGKYGYINKSGSFIVPPIYKTAGDFSEGKASVCRLKKRHKDKKDNIYPEVDEKYECSYIDRKGKVLFPFRQYFFGDFRNGLASACHRDTYYYFSQPSCGFIDANGNMVIGERFIQVGDFTNGYARVSVSSKPNLWGLINKKGDFVIKPIFTELGDVREGLISFKVGDDFSGKWGYLWAQ
jgi:hypothetical protein